MRLLRRNARGEIELTRDLAEHERPPYAILSHCWAQDNNDEVLLAEIKTGHKKLGYKKILFCAEQARKDGIDHFWIDTCCIDKTNSVELSEAITSMYRWYRNAVKCYVYLSDVSRPPETSSNDVYASWGPEFHISKWFTRGWTLQELLAPTTVEFFSREGIFLGTKTTMAAQIHEITSIPLDALRENAVHGFPVAERMRWVEARQTGKSEDRAYCMLGIFEVSMSVIYGEGEQQAYRRLRKEIQERLGPTHGSPHEHWCVHRMANPLFTGRQDLLHELEGTIRGVLFSPEQRHQCRIIISGIGGQGKSELCLQLSRRLRQAFWAVVWIDLNNVDTAQNSFIFAAKQLSLLHSNLEEALYAFANLQKPWLLVLDNADDPKVKYEIFFPDNPQCVILMTTRNEDMQHYSTERPVLLQKLDSHDAQNLLLKAAGTSPEQRDRHLEHAKQVASLLESHPLALVQAGAYIKQSHCLLADYATVYEVQRQRLLTFRPTQAQSRYGDVYATFEVSAERLKEIDTQASHDALSLIPLFAVCGPNHFPLSIFERAWVEGREVPLDLSPNAEDDNNQLLTPWHVANLPRICDVTPGTWDPFRLTEAVNLLKAFALVTITIIDDAKSVSLHPLVHAWARDRETKQQQRQGWLQMACLFGFGLDTRDGTKNRGYKSHVDALLGWSNLDIFSVNPTFLVARILIRCAWYLWLERADQQLLAFTYRILTALKLSPSEVRREWTGLYTVHARSLNLAGEHGEALIVINDIANISNKTLAIEHPYRLALQHALAVAYRDGGRVEEAIALLEHVVEVRGRTLAVEHPSRLVSQYELAVAYRDGGRVEEAIALLEHVVEVRGRTLAVEHPDRLVSQHALALAYRDGGRVEEAIALLEHVVEVQGRTLAVEHPDRLVSQYELAVAYRDGGRVEEAIALLEHVVEVRGRTLAVEHRNRLSSQHELAVAYRDGGRVEEAIALLEHVVKVRGRTLAVEHPKRLGSQHELATYYWDTGARVKALAMMSEVVNIQQRMLDADHPDRKNSEGWLAYMKQGLNEAGSSDGQTSENVLKETDQQQSVDTIIGSASSSNPSPAAVVDQPSRQQLSPTTPAATMNIAPRTAGQMKPSTTSASQQSPNSSVKRTNKLVQLFKPRFGREKKR